MADKNIKRLLKQATDQGWTIRDTKKGHQLLAPAGQGIVVIHKTPSDHRWLKNTVSQMRRYDPNFTWKD